MLVKSIFMELRSRLQSCNVYITTGVDFKKNCNLKISIQANCIVLNYYDDIKVKRRDSLSSIESLSDGSEKSDDGDDADVTTVISIEEFCRLIPNSMSCLKIYSNTISFRILTETKSGGNFFAEVLTAGNFSSNFKAGEININVKVDEELKFVCSNCCNIISNNVKFDRILELPSANLDMSEWFCHGHHGHGNEVMPTEDILSPNKTDFLYRLTYFVINNGILSEKTNKFNLRRDVYHCNRCLAWLGMKHKDTVKLFNSEVKISNDNVEKNAFTHKISTANLVTDDFIYTIESMTKEFNLGYQYAVMCKIVLESIISANKRQYLLIWVMDKELQVLRQKDVKHNGKIELQSQSLMKILYKIEMSLNDEVEMWLADPTVVSTNISKNMFCQGVEHLQKMSLRVPESFRIANGYCVSYLKV